MIRLRTRPRAREHGRDMRAIASSLSRQRATLTPYQTRTCAHCGRKTTLRARGPRRGLVLLRRVRPVRLTRQ
jgi:hypothetical protein